ncbi:MAG: GGDEF domain-containing protein [Nitrospiraceae bacterium]|nr:GGDEF domain-containing protein [Nitrospiraceae bacterium]
MTIKKLSLKWKTALPVITLLASGIVVSIFVTGYAAKEIVLKQERTVTLQHCRDTVVNALTSMMIGGTYTQKSLNNYLDQMHSIADIKVVAGKKIMDQYGAISYDRYNTVPDSVETRVLQSGKKKVYIDGNYIRGVYPFIATTDGSESCLACHNVNNGDVLGIINIRVPLKETLADIRSWQSTFAFLGLLTLLLASFVVTATVNFTHKPLDKLVDDMKAMVEKQSGPKTGDEKDGDEIIRLSRSVDGIIRAFRIMVNNMEDIAKFKKIIEEDDDLAEVYSRLGREFNYYDFDGVTIYEIANSQNKMKLVYPVELSGAEISCNQEMLENCSLCRAKRTGHLISSINNSGICRYFLKGPEMEHICIPMMAGSTASGVVQFIVDKAYMSGLHKEAVEAWTDSARRLIDESMPVIESKRLMATLRESAMKDPLTGLHNRRFLQEYAESLIAGAMRRGKNLGIIMGDLDFFKQVNDVYGHNAGDGILKETAEILKKNVRASDMVIRFGGEEFLIVLVDAADDESASIAEKIREKVENSKFKVSDGILKKTISFGISEFPRDASSFWQCIKFADVALYEAKNRGRNNCVKFTKEMWKDEQF